MKYKHNNLIELYKKSNRDIIKAIQKGYNSLSDFEKILWDIMDIYNDEFYLPMYIYGKAIDPEELDRFLKELHLNLLYQGFLRRC